MSEDKTKSKYTEEVFYDLIAQYIFNKTGKTDITLSDVADYSDEFMLEFTKAVKESK